MIVVKGLWVLRRLVRSSVVNRDDEVELQAAGDEVPKRGTLPQAEITEGDAAD